MCIRDRYNTCLHLIIEYKLVRACLLTGVTRAHNVTYGLLATYRSGPFTISINCHPYMIYPNNLYRIMNLYESTNPQPCLLYTSRCV